MTTNKYTKYLPLKSAIEDLFGTEAWYDLKESNHIPTWKKYGVRTLRAIGVSIAGTVKAYDDEWHAEVSETLDKGVNAIKGCSDIDDIAASLAGTLIRISFLQIGLMPDRKGTDRRVTLHKDSWRLDPFRSVFYIQTKEQKEKLFWKTQQKKIGFEAQLNMFTEYKSSKAKNCYSEWCKEKKNSQ